MRAVALPAFLILLATYPAATLAATPAPMGEQPEPAVVDAPPVGMIPEQVVLSRDLATRQPALTFGLQDRIYLIMTWRGLPEGPHSLRVSWIDPRGSIAEETLYSFVVLGPTIRYDTWVWMQVRPPDPGVVYDYGAFLGDWTVKGYLDGIAVLSSGFRLDREAPPAEGARP